ncbi:hypothetical protein Poly24_18460 [Rosistilla carotiformis]|uniref:Uncharacterized protein n=1 Tax=Rosistilla carotiformis TaxID=2528017 RepID=A0A518JRH2_9BACT|nr:hypothetical protein [Rosistilla carotiformis]QDV68138.1 hypothetical protein Poly24_18460 [Rosistilla carotiformis]
MRRSAKLRGNLGTCGFALASAVFGCLLLILNGGVVAAVYFAIAEDGPEWMRNRSLSQFALFVGPVLLLILQWTLIDLVGRDRRGESSHSPTPIDSHRVDSTKA